MAVQELRGVLDQRFERLERDVRDIQEKLDKALALLNYQRGQRAFFSTLLETCGVDCPDHYSTGGTSQKFF